MKLLRQVRPEGIDRDRGWSNADEGEGIGGGHLVRWTDHRIAERHIETEAPVIRLVGEHRLHVKSTTFIEDTLAGDRLAPHPVLDAKQEEVIELSKARDADP